MKTGIWKKCQCVCSVQLSQCFLSISEDYWCCCAAWRALWRRRVSWAARKGAVGLSTNLSGSSVFLESKTPSSLRQGGLHLIAGALNTWAGSAFSCVPFLCYRKRRRSPWWCMLATREGNTKGWRGKCSKGGRVIVQGLEQWILEFLDPVLTSLSWDNQGSAVLWINTAAL